MAEFSASDEKILELLQPPPPRDPVEEGKKMFAAQKKLAPGIFNQTEEYIPRLQGIRGESMAGISGLLREENPELYALLDEQGNLALEGLQSGGRLSEDEVRNIEQDSRSGWSDRGLVRSNPALVTEVMGLEGARRDRIDEDKRYAMGVSGLLSGERDFVYNSGSTDTAGLMSMFDPWNDYASQLFGQNYDGALNVFGTRYSGMQNNDITRLNNMSAENIGRMNRDAQIYSGLIGGGASAGGSIGAAAILACWVAREVYGADNPKWRMFRNWLLSDAPKWFRALYLAYGPGFAKWIADKPRLKNIISRWMDVRIGAGRSEQIPAEYKGMIQEVA